MTLIRKAQGRLWLDKVWHLSCAPHIAMAVKRVFPRVELLAKQFHFTNTASNCWDLRWFAEKYPLDVLNRDKLEGGAKQYEQTLAFLAELDGPEYSPRSYPLRKPLRDYQAKTNDLFARLSRGLLLADELGLGKSITFCGALTTAEALPAAVVCYSHLQLQWHRVIREFLPGALPHIVKSQKMYDPCEHTVTKRSDKEGGHFFSIDGVACNDAEHDEWCRSARIAPRARGRVRTRYPDVLILTYTKLQYWADYMSTIIRTLGYDEVQEMRVNTSDKYKAGQRLGRNVRRIMGLSATPIYNYGGEVFNVVDVIAPGALGEWDEFAREWTTGGGSDRGKALLKDPAALGTYLRAEHLMVRHTRVDVGRELPPVSRFTQVVEANEGGLEKVGAIARELAAIILGHDQHKRSGIDLMQAGAEFVSLLRRETGIAKAPGVAAFVKMILEAGEPVILSGWHHAVYDIWKDLFKDHHPLFYTGNETAGEKDRSRARFLKGDSNLLIVSNRSGAGLDGLQGSRCKTAVIGEFDWSPQPHKQFIGRIHRDGQTDPIFAYFCYCNSGSDPVMLDVLGLKDQQAKGLNDPWASDAPELADGAAQNNAQRLAIAYLQRHGVPA